MDAAYCGLLPVLDADRVPVVMKRLDTKTKFLSSEKSIQSPVETEIQIKDEPEWDASSIEEEERSIAEMFHAEMSVKCEPTDEVDIEEESLVSTCLVY